MKSENMKSVIKKITSRKFLAAVVGVISGLSMVFGLEESVISTVSGATVAVASLTAYILAEGRIDEAAVALSSGAADATKPAEKS